MSTREVISSVLPLIIICEANKQHGGGGGGEGRLCLAVSVLVKVSRGGRLCELQTYLDYYQLSANDPQEEKSRLSEKTQSSLLAGGVRFPLDPGDPTCEKTWGLKNSAHLSVSID